MAATAGPTRVEAPTPEQLVERARSLALTFRKRSEAERAARRLPVESVDELKASGLFKVFQAERNGGFEMDVATHLAVVSAIAEGCPSTAWVVGVVHAHSWMMSHYPEQAQVDVYGDNPDAVVSAVIRPRGQAVKVDGGYRLSGFWPFGSGCEHADWLLLGAPIVDESGNKLDEGDLLLPTTDAELKDDWLVDGLRATGSCSIVVDDVFVPEHRYLSLPGLHTGRTPGAALHSGPLVDASPVPVLSIALTGASIGAARGALADFLDQVKDRTLTYAGHTQAQWSVTHAKLGDAAVRIDEAQLLLERSAKLIDEHAAAGTPMPAQLRATVRMDCGQSVRRCMEATEMLYLATGGSGLKSTNRMGLLLADLRAMNMHALLDIDTNREMYGRVLLGLDAPLV